MYNLRFPSPTVDTPIELKKKKKNPLKIFHCQCVLYTNMIGKKNWTYLLKYNVII